MQTTTRALEHLLCAIGDPVAELRGIGPQHPEFVRAQTIRAGAGVLAKVPDALPGIERAIRAADGAALSERTRSHLAAAQAWLSGDPLLAAESYAYILARWPFDLLALRLAHSCYFFLGQHRRLCEVIDSLVPAWTDEEQRGFRLFLAMASFAYAESGDGAGAEALGRQALSYEPGCPMGVHAVAHALAESGQHREGARWMRDQRGHWATESRMRSHNAWHLAMFEIGDGNPAVAIDILDRCLIPASAGSPLDACDAAGLQWRLTLEGASDRGRWSRLSDAFEPMTPGFWPYVDLHAALAHWSAGREDRANRLALQIERCADGRGYAALRARHVTRPGLAALIAWAEGRYADAATSFADLAPFLGDAGGSGIQLAVFRSIGEEAVRRQRLRSGSRALSFPAARAPVSLHPTRQGDLKWKRRATTDHAFAAQCSSP